MSKHTEYNLTVRLTPELVKKLEERVAESELENLTAQESLQSICQLSRIVSAVKATAL